MRKYSEEVAEKAYQQGEEAGKEIGQRQANIAAIKNMIIRFRATKEVILEDYRMGRVDLYIFYPDDFDTYVMEFRVRWRNGRYPLCQQWLVSDGRWKRKSP